jgi:hypothetical protein
MTASGFPCQNTMRQQLEHLFGGNLDGCHDGLIEVAYTDASDNKLKHARLFGTEEMDDAVAFAVQQNQIPGQNIYVGVALRKPDTPRDRRAADIDVLALPAYYVDIDKGEAVVAAKNRYNGCPPTCVVITGRHPHIRAQLWWRLENPDRDLDRARRQNTALATAFEGDTTVVNPSRVMRLAGSIAWPTKTGRVQEKTEFQSFQDGRPQFYYEGQLAKSFSPDAVPSTVTAKTISGLNIGSGDPHAVATALEAIKAGQNWHNNALRLIAHWIGRGWSDAEILTTAEAFTLPPYSVDQTRRDVAQMIVGARSKWSIPSPDHHVNEFCGSPLSPSFVTELNLSMLPPRKWVLGRMLLRDYVTMMVSPPGIGKTTLMLSAAIAICTGRDLTGHDIHEQGKVWLHNNEDDGDELKRRLAAVIQHFDIPLEEIKNRLVLSSGADRPLIIARKDRNNNVVAQPDVNACIEFIKANDIKVFIVDPFVETHTVDENSNEQIKEVVSLYREIARKAKCAVMIVHHTSKPQQGQSDGHAGNMNTARGASSMLGVVRVVVTLYGMSAKDAEVYGIEDAERHLYVRLDDAKANLSLTSGEAKWFKRLGVTIGNGDEVGILTPATLTAKYASNSRQNDELKTIISEILHRTKASHQTLNAGAVVLAWSEDARFHKFRETDANGYQKASRALRDKIRKACQLKITVTTDKGEEGFTLRDQTPATLIRFCTPHSNTSPASNDALSQPVFMEE